MIHELCENLRITKMFCLKILIRFQFPKAAMLIAYYANNGIHIYLIEIL